MVGVARWSWRWRGRLSCVVMVRRRRLALIRRFIWATCWVVLFHAKTQSIWFIEYTNNSSSNMFGMIVVDEYVYIKGIKRGEREQK